MVVMVSLAVLLPPPPSLWPDPPVQVVKGDFDDADSLRAALAGMDRAFLVSAP